MTATWDLPDFDDHEGVHLFRDIESGLCAIIAVHSTHLGPAAGGVRFWHYEDSTDAVTDALRLSRGMSYKNAMAGLPLGGGKAVILADEERTKTKAMLEAFGDAVDSLDGRYTTAEDVNMTTDDMVVISGRTKHVSGLPVESDRAGGDPGPFTALGIFLGIKAAVRHKLNKDSIEGVHVAIQGVGSVGGGLAHLLKEEGARLTIADMNGDRAKALAGELGADIVSVDEILSVEADVVSPCALGAVLDAESIAALDTPIVAGGANNQLATREDGRRLHERGILFAPDYVINAGGIINVASQFLTHGDRAGVEAKIGEIPDRLAQVWRESEESGDPAAEVADRIAQRMIGRG